MAFRFGRGETTTRPKLRAELLPIWRWFCDLSDRRDWVTTVEPENDKVAGFGWRVKSSPRRISHSEIDGWQRLHGIALKSWQVAALTLLDDAFIEDAISPHLPPGVGPDTTGKTLAEQLKRFAKRKKQKNG